MAETKKPAAKSAAVKTTETTAASKPAKVAEKKASTGSKKPAQTTRLYEMYNNEIKKQLVEKFKYTSVMQAPKLEKVVINIGVGDALTDNKALDAAVKELAQITGQHPVTTKAKKSIATFKLRQGQEIGCKVTLRGIRMYEFMDRLISIALPRVRDFRGVSKNSFDGHGNYTLGIKEQLIFPEIEYDKVSKVRGMDIVVVTTANTDEEAYALLDMLGMPFHK